VWEVGTDPGFPIESAPATSGAPGVAADVAARDPFPLASVQAVAALAWRLALRVDPVGLLVVPFAIFFPVYVFFALLGEIVHTLSTLPLDDPAVARTIGDTIPFGAIVGALPLVVFAAAFGASWLQVRSDALARGGPDPPAFGATATRALARVWPLALTTVIVYVLWQVAAFAFLLPGLVVFALTSFATRAAVLDDLGPMAALRASKHLVVEHWLAWLGMGTWWVIVFLGLGILVGIARFSLAGVTGTAEGSSAGLALDLLLGLPLPIALLVSETCWTLFFRELEARSRVAGSNAAVVPAAAASSAHTSAAAPPAA
jgi:hypothetical protein